MDFLHPILKIREEILSPEKNMFVREIAVLFI
jgi:hypothetical protein